MTDEMENTHCAECKMIVFDGEYHPYTACILYRQLGQADKVRSCLDSVIEYATRSTPPVSQGARAAAEGDLISREEVLKVVDVCTCGSGPEFRAVNMRYHAIGCSTHIATLIRSLPTAPAVGGVPEWRDIATAPKGRKLLVGYHNPAGKWRTIMATYFEDGTLESDTTDSGWATAGWYEATEAYEYLMPVEIEPELWQPLPPPPVALSDKTEGETK